MNFSRLNLSSRRLILLINYLHASNHHKADILPWLIKLLRDYSQDPDVLNKQHEIAFEEFHEMPVSITLDELLSRFNRDKPPLEVILDKWRFIHWYETLQQGIVQSTSNPNPTAVSIAPVIAPEATRIEVAHALSRWFYHLRENNNWGGSGFWGLQGSYTFVNHPLLWLWMHFSWHTPMKESKLSCYDSRLYGHTIKWSVSILASQNLKCLWDVPSFTLFRKNLLSNPLFCEVAKELLYKCGSLF